MHTELYIILPLKFLTYIAASLALQLSHNVLHFSLYQILNTKFKITFQKPYNNQVLSMDIFADHF